jgi:hypothetical protein
MPERFLRRPGIGGMCSLSGEMDDVAPVRTFLERGDVEAGARRFPRRPGEGEERVRATDEVELPPPPQVGAECRDLDGVTGVEKFADRLGDLGVLLGEPDVRAECRNHGGGVRISDRRREQGTFAGLVVGKVTLRPAAVLGSVG